MPLAPARCGFRAPARSAAGRGGRRTEEGQKGLGQASAGMTVHYSHAGSASVRAGLERIADRLTGKAGGTVVELPRRTGTED